MFAIAIDGPAGAGKSSVAKAAAKELGFTYVDTGAIYRAIALYMLEKGVDLEDPAAVTAELTGVEVSLEYGEFGQRTLLGGRNVSEEIRTQEVSMATSKWVAHIPEVREFLVGIQRDLHSFPTRRSSDLRSGPDGAPGSLRRRGSPRTFSRCLKRWSSGISRTRPSWTCCPRTALCWTAQG